MHVHTERGRERQREINVKGFKGYQQDKNVLPFTIRIQQYTRCTGQHIKQGKGNQRSTY